MGIVEKEAAAFEFSNGQRHRIELDSSGIIHLHMDNVRITLLKEEFYQLVSTVLEAREELADRKRW